MVNLKRSIGVFSLITYYFSTVIGVGVFVVPLEAANIAGPISFLAWIIVLILAYPLAMVFSHIAQLFPYSDSIPHFVNQVAGKKIGKMISIFLIMISIIGTPLLGLASADYFQHLLHIEDNTFIFAIIMMTLSTIFNLIGIKTSSLIQSLCLIILISAIFLVISISVPHFNSNNLYPAAPNGWGSIVPAVIVCFYSVVGWENVSAISEEVHNPYHSYKTAIRIAIILISLFYLLLAITTILIIPYDQLDKNKALISNLLEISGIYGFGYIIDIMSLLLIFLGANVWIMGPSRLIFALARSGLLPKYFAKASHNNIPIRATIVQYFILVFILLFMQFYNLTKCDLLKQCGLNYMILYSIIMICGIKCFTPIKWKIMALIPLLVMMFFIPQEIKGLEFSLSSIILCFLYVTLSDILKKKNKVDDKL